MPETASSSHYGTPPPDERDRCADSGNVVAHNLPSVLFESDDKSIVLVDIPRTLEEAQVLPSVLSEARPPPLPRICSADPPAVPFPTPEPRHGAAAHSGGCSRLSPASQVADLMTAAVVRDALDHVTARYTGPFHLPRIVHSQPPLPKSGEEGQDATPVPPIPQLFIPQDAKFLHGSVQNMKCEFRDTAPIFDLIVLDPPWPNRSARRRTNKYATVANLSQMQALLVDVPVGSCLSHEGLVAVWITNKPGVIDFLAGSAGVFAAWGLELAAEWTWVKVTASGDPLYDLDATWRKPWEKLLIAKRVGAPVNPAIRPKTVIAVPDLHSRKPNLRGLFQGVFGGEYKGLEVFARNLTAGWWGWGSEVIQFQNHCHWEWGTDYFGENGLTTSTLQS